MARSIPFTLVAAILLNPTTLWDQSGKVPSNLRFEQGESAKTPPGWLVRAQGWSATITGENCREGRQCARLGPNEDPPSADFGDLMQTVDSTPYRKKLIRLRAAVRTQHASPGLGAQMWLRVDRPRQRMGFFNNMDDRPIVGDEWDYYAIVGPVSDDAEALNFGVFVRGSAVAWIDDVSIEILGDAAPTMTESPRPLNERGAENLFAFARLFGYVRFFHPSDEAAAANWSRVALEGVRAVEPAENSDALSRKLEDHFRSIAPTLRVFPTGKPSPTADELREPADLSGLSIAGWKHRGFGTGKAQSIYTSQRVYAKLDRSLLDVLTGEASANDWTKPSEPILVDLGGGVSCSFPITLYVKDGGTLPKTAALPPLSPPQSDYAASGDDRATRLSDVILCWTVMEHFYPYFDVVNADWPAELRRALLASATDADERAFTTTLRRMIAALHDGHGNVWHAADSGGGGLPFLWDWIENHLVFTHVAEGASAELQVGEVVRRIDGKPAMDELARKEELISGATPQWRRFRALERLRTGDVGGWIELEIEHVDGSIRSTVFAFTLPYGRLAEPRPPKIAELHSGVFYVDIGRITDDDFRDALPKLEKAKGIVFDFRGYPNQLSAWVFFPHIIAQTIVSPQWHVPLIRRPDRATWEWDRGGEWRIEPRAPYLKANKAFLIDGRAISYAESCLGIIEHYRLGELVGGPTAGTNGNINPFELPGGYNVIWTGMKVLKQDGSQHHGVGILPTAPVHRTRRGVAEGRDEFLEKAIEIVTR